MTARRLGVRRRQAACRVVDALVVDGETRDGDRPRAGSDDDLVGFDRQLAVGAIDFDDAV